MLVTGAAGGIGAAITKALVAAGHSVAAVDRDAAALARLAAFGAHPSVPVPTCRSKPPAARPSPSAVARFGRLDAVINNAGIGV